MNIGVLALQGDFQEHIDILGNLGVSASEIRNAQDLKANFDGIILPGGESTVMSRLLQELNMVTDLQQIIKSGVPVFGTCAGLILLAKDIEGNEKSCLNVMDVKVKRNGYGRQLASFKAEGALNGKTVPLVFIRAPYITAVGDKVKILVQVEDKIVAAREDNMLATSFHPELTRDFTVHKLFLDMIREKI